MNKTFSVLTLAAVLAAGVSVVSCSSPSGDSDVIKIGVVEPQSGDNGAGGKQEILGMQYANSLTPTVDIGGETYTVELIYADNQSSNERLIGAQSGPLVAKHARDQLRFILALAQRGQRENADRDAVIKIFAECPVR